MPGEKDIDRMLASLEPILHAGDYVYCTMTDISRIDVREAVLIFRELEGMTVILDREKADRLGISYHYVSAWITLAVHSSLDAVGLTAAFSTALGEAGISCNVVAGYYHDHIFVGKEDAERAVTVLRRLRG